MKRVAFLIAVVGAFGFAGPSPSASAGTLCWACFPNDGETMTNPAGQEGVYFFDACDQDWNDDYWDQCSMSPGQWVWHSGLSEWFWDQSCWAFDPSESCHGTGDAFQAIEITGSGRFAAPTSSSVPAKDGMRLACGGMLVGRSYDDAVSETLRWATREIAF